MSSTHLFELKKIADAMYPSCTEFNPPRIYWAQSGHGCIISIRIKCNNSGVSSDWLKWMCDSSWVAELLSESTLHMALSFDLFKQFVVSHLDTIKHIVYDMTVVSSMIFVTDWLKSLE